MKSLTAWFLSELCCQDRKEAAQRVEQKLDYPMKLGSAGSKSALPASSHCEKLSSSRGKCDKLHGFKLCGILDFLFFLGKDDLVLRLLMGLL